MAARNAREGATPAGITPQTFGKATDDKFNREAASEVGDLKKAVAEVTPEAPAEGEAPADTALFALRAVDHGWPFTTGAVSVTGFNTGADIPGTGVGLGTVYKGERVNFHFHVNDVASSGAAYFRLSLLGRAGQGSPEAVVAETTPYMANPLAPPSPTVFAGALFELDRQVFDARLRVQLGSAGGSASIPANAPMLQFFQIFTPIRRPPSE